jgi:hypothetical protein
MKQFFKDLGVTQTRGLVRISNSFNGLTQEEKKEAVLIGIKANPKAELNTRQIWLYFNSFLSDKENINRPEKVAVMGSNEATEANRTEAIIQLSKEIIKEAKKVEETDVAKGLKRRNIFTFLK